MGGCGGVSIRVDLLDAEVARQLFDHVAQPVFAREVRRAVRAATAAGSETANLTDRLRRDRARLDELGDAFGDGDLDRAQYVRQVDRVRARIEDTERHLVDTDTDTALLAIDAKTLRDDWDTMTLDERRTVLTALRTSVTVAPVAMRAVPARDRVTVTFSDGAG
jgi:hypothetical protein